MFMSLDPDDKRRLVSVLISGSTWKEGELSVTFRPPFDMILHGVLQARTVSSPSLCRGLRSMWLV
jgi:hypothetical protein